jgi:hypothetical protein
VSLDWSRRSSLESTLNADSLAAMNPAKPTRTTLRKIVRKMFTLGLSAPFAQSMTDQDVALKGEHFLLFLRLCMIKAE